MYHMSYIQMEFRILDSIDADFNILQLHTKSDKYFHVDTVWSNMLLSKNHWCDVTDALFSQNCKENGDSVILFIFSRILS